MDAVREDVTPTRASCVQETTARLASTCMGPSRLGGLWNALECVQPWTSLTSDYVGVSKPVEQ
ncbi:hypothetical protein CERZMDRAFT_91553 [Cercospora zeae-maydis SCOH1-5]|uniref:Uncharacterized protein n=1 Tax=Cercospora zeae-maydis SCOH1-5 TaxID=717836 RepID=A0A6A6F5D5_9PEZI|nr:hypothetical protein CERZMDRAFT_91553 [Cercospora zeae-maydis SCOH1-5]